MANSLLDFVISLVRDPDVAARYAANPAQAIADAHLTDVTSVDVNNLIPMVSDSLSMAGGAGTGTGTHIADHGNVWASGAAAAALDAFSPHIGAGTVDHFVRPTGVINQPTTPGVGDVTTDPHPSGIAPHQPSVLLTGAEMPDTVVDHGGYLPDDPGIWDHPVIHPHTVEADHHGFGIHG
ncbi:MAG: Rv0340 family IniB-related protein [Mycobacterium sp.]